MIKFIGKMIKYFLLFVLVIGLIGYLTDDGVECLAEDTMLMTVMAKKEVEKLAKFDIVDTSGGYFGDEIIKNDTLKKISVTLKSKNGFNATATNFFTVKYLI